MIAPGAALQPIAGKPAPTSIALTLGHVQYLWELACRRKEGKALPCGLQPFLTLNHAAYNAGRNNRVNTVATIKPPMIATAIGP
ncbi:hypothetical protein N436_04976 [Pseudomonas sp. RV120224-01b]|nr:hypothetical protein N428_05020 [Pseudomonas sp. RV120224-01c]PYG77847.1 hypothetical protein N436_04976 [Pseudomonas sp. RV120224-01b]